jgi:hypothetical protein
MWRFRSADLLGRPIIMRPWWGQHRSAGSSIFPFNRLALTLLRPPPSLRVLSVLEKRFHAYQT